MKFSPLREQLLTLALTGQLVEQHAAEPEVQQIGPAPAPDEEPFAIPAKWRWVRLEQVCTYIQRGKSPKYSEIKQLPVVAQKCNRWDGLHMELALFIAPETIASYQAERFLQQNDVLLNSTGTGTLGRVGMYDVALNPYGQAVADGHVTVIRADQSLILPSLIKYALSSATFQAIIIDAGTGTTKQQELALAKVKQLLIPLPPLEEQKRIVAVLDDLMARLDQMEQAYSELTGPMCGHFRNLVLQQAISGQLVPQLDSEPEVEQVGPAPAPDEVPFALPAKWRWVKFESVLELISGRDLTLAQISSTPDEVMTPYVTGASQIEHGAILINRWTAQPSVISEEGDVLLTCKGTVGKLALNSYGSMHIARQIMAVRCGLLCEPSFVLMYLQSFMSKLKANAKGLIPGITRKDVLGLWLPLPPLEEQRRIVTKLDELFAGVKQLSSLKEFGVE